MIEVQKMIRAGDEFYNSGYWDKAEWYYERAIHMCDFKINLLRRDRQTIRFLEKKGEAVSRMAEIAASMHREDDAERLEQLSREIVEYLRNEAHKYKIHSRHACPTFGAVDPAA